MAGKENDSRFPEVKEAIDRARADLSIILGLTHKESDSPKRTSKSGNSTPRDGAAADSRSCSSKV